MQFSNALLAAAAVSVVSANFSESVDQAISSLNALDSAVKGWSSGAGLVGALAIQNKYAPLTSAVNNLAGAVGSASQADIEGSNIVQLGSSIVSTLDSLVAKANDIKAVGASSIVSSDIKGLLDPTKNIESGLKKVVSDQAYLSNTAKPALDKVAQAFTSAGSVYGVDVGTFPNI